MAVPFQVNPAADLTYWQTLGGFVVANGEGEILANFSKDRAGLDMLIAGASAQRLSVYNYDQQQFDTGTVGQLYEGQGARIAREMFGD